jgi:DNA repair protein RadD
MPSTFSRSFLAANVPCGYIDAYSKPLERKTLERDFRKGTIRVACSVGVLTTGIDWDVRCISLARPTKSEMLFVQMIGRGLRTAPGKQDCLILDHSDTTLRLGFPADIHHEHLDDGKERAKPTASTEGLPKKCPECAFLKPPKLARCPSCGFETKHGPRAVEVHGRAACRGDARQAVESRREATRVRPVEGVCSGKGLCGGVGLA